MRAEGRGGATDNEEVRRGGADGAGGKVQGDDSAVRAADSGGDGEEPGGGPLRSVLDQDGDVRGGAHGEGAAGQAHGQDTECQARAGMERKGLFFFFFSCAMVSVPVFPLNLRLMI